MKGLLTACFGIGGRGSNEVMPAQTCCTSNSRPHPPLIKEFPFAVVTYSQTGSHIEYRPSANVGSTPEVTWLKQQNAFNNRCSVDQDTRNPIIDTILNERKANAGVMYNAKRRMSQSVCGAESNITHRGQSGQSRHSPHRLSISAHLSQSTPVIKFPSEIIGLQRSHTPEWD